MIYIDHETNSAIATKTKLNTININKLNLKLIKTFTYLSQFRIEILHKSKKFNVIFDALSRFSMKSLTKKKKDNLNIDAKNSNADQTYAYANILMKINFEFRKFLINDYFKNSA